jgi:ABC-type transport system involved in cytochrome bd biosynthesis fused ATPase/permease subunit
VKFQGPTAAERVTEVALCVICVVVAIALAAWQRSLILMIFAAVVTVLIPFSLMRSRKLGEEEMIRRQDKAMGKPTDDPNEMARWVP